MKKYWISCLLVALMISFFPTEVFCASDDAQQQVYSETEISEGDSYLCDLALYSPRFSHRGEKLGKITNGCPAYRMVYRTAV